MLLLTKIEMLHDVLSLSVSRNSILVVPPFLFSFSLSGESESIISPPPSRSSLFFSNTKVLKDQGGKHIAATAASSSSSSALTGARFGPEEIGLHGWIK